MPVPSSRYRDFVEAICDCFMFNSFHVGVNKTSILLQPLSASQTLISLSVEANLKGCLSLPGVSIRVSG